MNSEITPTEIRTQVNDRYLISSIYGCISIHPETYGWTTTIWELQDDGIQDLIHCETNVSDSTGVVLRHSGIYRRIIENHGKLKLREV